MILYPSLEELEKKIGLRFSVVMAVAKRARQLTEGTKTYYTGDSHNSLTIATHELSTGSVICVPKEEGYFEMPETTGTTEE